MNEADSERLSAMLSAEGYEHTSLLAKADLVVINTCCVRESAEKRIYGKIGELKKYKAENPERIICVMGCMAQKDKDRILERARHVDIVLGTSEIARLPELVAAVKAKRQKIVATAEGEAEYPARALLSPGQVSVLIPIMTGCNNYCTYCIVPYVRGRERSRPAKEIMTEIEEAARGGAKEIILLGQNVNSYGKDRPEDNIRFSDLLSIIDRDSPVERVRFITSHPRDMDEDTIFAIKNGHKLCEHIHLPVQSGSDRVLKQMNRGYSTEHYRNVVDAIRRHIPNCSITTDIIVGFPGETEADFQETLDFVREMRFDAAYTFMYSRRSGTRAAAMEGQIPDEVKKERLHRLMNVQNSISLKINRELEGSVAEVLAEGPSKDDPNHWTGRTRTNKVVLWPVSGLAPRPGDLLNIRILKAQTWVVKGVIADSGD